MTPHRPSHASRGTGRIGTRPVVLVAALVLVPALIVPALTACSGGGTRAAAPSTASGAGGSANSPGTPARSVTIKVTPPLRSTCSMLDRATAARLLGASTTGRAADVRHPAPGTAQLDGCSYQATGGRSLEYLVWSTTGSRPGTPSSPPLPANAPVVRFDPKIGQSSSGLVITAGGRTSVVVSAARPGRLVQVTVAGPDAARAKQAATGTARTLVAAR